MVKPGLSIYIDGVAEIDAADKEDFHAQAVDIEADVESVIAAALADHPFIQDGATVKADYVESADE